MAAYAAVVSLTNTIQDIINHPRISTFFDDKQIQHLLEKTSLLLDFMEANNYGGVSKEADELEMEIKSAAQAAEDVIDLHIMDQLYDEDLCLLDLEQKIDDMEGVMKKASEFKGKQKGGEEQRTPQMVPVMEIEETAMVGLDAELYKLLDELTRDPQSSRKTISIVGMGGTGKTTLAKNIFENKLIKEYFDFRGWATISQHHNGQEIIKQLLSNSGDGLHKKLFGRRYLIILDDIWSVNAWDEVRSFFPDNKNGSRIVLTTRLSNVANDCGSSPFMMRLLDEATSWELFCKKAFKNESYPLELQEVGKEIVKLCKGLALSVVVMGGFLSKSPRTIEYWKGVLKDIKSISGESLDVLSLSYKHLPAHLKPCFLYLGVFKEDSEFRVSRVVKLWVAEGFMKTNGSGVLLEEIGEGYIKDLTERNLISVGRRGKNGNIKSCCIHDLLRDLCIKLGEQQQFFSVTRYDESLNPTARRIIGQHVDFTKDRIPLARAIMAYTSFGQPIKQVLLRVLEIPNIVYSGPELYENVNLRHLAYQLQYSSHVEKLFTSISLMWNLQTLTIYVRFGVVVAPAEIWKLRQLRHLDCFSIYLPLFNGQDQDELLILENLQTLKQALNLRLCTKVCKMIPNIKKLYLCYNVDDGKYGYDDSLLEYLCNLDRMHKLESLNLVIESRRGASCGDAKLNEKLAFPKSLKKLSLSGCKFHWDDLRIIGSLPQLEVLNLYPYAVTKGDRWSPITAQFPSLKFLMIYDSDHILQYWDVDNSHFPVLEKLLLGSVNSLEEIPPEIGDIPTLDLIHVYDCSMSAAISAIKIKEDQLDNGNDTLQILVTVDESEVEDFKESVEAEGLSITSIQLEIEQIK